jgi:hypothetical protein
MVINWNGHRVSGILAMSRSIGKGLFASVGFNPAGIINVRRKL